jgi:hypothetical protein
MKSYFPFTDYDFWAYISCGFVFLFALDHVLQTAIFQRSTWTLVEGLIAVAAAYVVGHLLAVLSSATNNTIRYLGSPTSVEDGFGDVRGEIAEADEPREIGRAHPFPLGQCGKRHPIAAHECGIEPVRPDQQLDQPCIRGLE